MRVLEQVVAWRGQPRVIRLDNSPEFSAERFMTSCAERAIELRYIQPGKPDQNAFIEGFTRTYRTEVLSTYGFEPLEQARRSAPDDDGVTMTSGPMTPSLPPGNASTLGKNSLIIWEQSPISPHDISVLVVGWELEGCHEAAPPRETAFRVARLL